MRCRGFRKDKEYDDKEETFAQPQVDRTLDSVTVFSSDFGSRNWELAARPVCDKRIGEPEAAHALPRAI